MELTIQEILIGVNTIIQQLEIPIDKLGIELFIKPDMQ